MYVVVFDFYVDLSGSQPDLEADFAITSLLDENAVSWKISRSYLFETSMLNCESTSLPERCTKTYSTVLSHSVDSPPEDAAEQRRVETLRRGQPPLDLAHGHLVLGGGGEQRQSARHAAEHVGRRRHSCKHHVALKHWFCVRGQTNGDLRGWENSS